MMMSYNYIDNYQVIGLFYQKTEYHLSVDILQYIRLARMPCTLEIFGLITFFSAGGFAEPLKKNGYNLTL